MSPFVKLCPLLKYDRFPAFDDQWYSKITLESVTFSSVGVWYQCFFSKLFAARDSSAAMVLAPLRELSLNVKKSLLRYGHPGYK